MNYISKSLSLILLMVLSPIFFIVSAVILIFDGRPIFFKQKRVGINNIIFQIYKFRTMKKDTKEIASHLLRDKDINYTLSGKILRRFSIDELPQLINILKGEMVFIGPRPALYNQYDLIKKRTDLNIHKLLPGVTGWAQINGRDKIGIDEKVLKDHYYLINKSLFMNLKIIFFTIMKVIKTSDIKN